jgi:rod shape-determining protein MreD
MSFFKREYDQAQAAGESLPDAARRLGVIVLQALILVFLTAFPFPFLRFSDVRPAFMLMAVFHWAVFRPQAFSPFAAFFCGLLLDLLVASPFGLNAVTLFAMRHLTVMQVKFLSRQSFIVLWMCFALMAAGAFALQWIVFSMFSQQLVPLRPLAVSAGLTALFFPPVSWLLGLFGRNRDEPPV